MYCKKCGIRIKEGQEKCPECGTEQDKPEYCGGFWGLIGNQREDEASRQIQKQPDTEQDRMYQEQKKELQETKELLKEKQRLKQQCETLKKSCQRQKCYTAVLTGIVVLLAVVSMILTILLLQDAKRPDEAVTVKMETEQQDGYAPSEKQTFPQKQNNQGNQKQNNQKNQKQNSQSRNEQNQNDRKDQEQKSPDKKNGQRNQAETV